MSPDPTPGRSIIRFGSLTARLHYPRERHGVDVATIFGTSLKTPSPELLSKVELEIHFTEPGRDEWPNRPDIPEDGMILRHLPACPEIHTEAISARLERGQTPARIEVAVFEPDMPHFDLCVHFAVVFHKLLFLMGRVVLHAAAVRFQGNVVLFLGDKGAGKSTVCLELARQGGTVLGEDHLILTRILDRSSLPGSRAAAHFRVSGCDERSRLTSKTERHFFDEPLEGEVRDFAGTLKKEMHAGALFDSLPYTDHPADLLFFSRVGESFRVTELPRQLALLKLMQATGKLQRFVDPMDRSRFLDLLSDFVRTIRAFDLELSDDLGELHRLVELLQDQAGEPTR
jgi:hypothetical protein